MGLFNIDVGAVTEGLFGIIDDLVTTDDERAEAKRKLLEMDMQERLAQLAVNAREAGHRSVFVAGWRPFIGWVCGVALAYHFILQPLLVNSVIVLGRMYELPVTATDFPPMELGSLQTVLLGMLGLGGLRTFEKFKGIAK